MKFIILAGFGLMVFGLLYKANRIPNHSFRVGHKIAKTKSTSPEIQIQVGNDFKKVVFPTAHFLIASDSYPITPESKIEAFQVTQSEWARDITPSKRVSLHDLSQVFEGL